MFPSTPIAQTPPPDAAPAPPTSLPRPQEFLSRRHITNRIVHKHAVKFLPQPQPPHIFQEMLAIGIDPPAFRQHPLGDIRQGPRKIPLQVESVVPSARPQFQHGPRLSPAISANRRRPPPHTLPPPKVHAIISQTRRTSACFQYPPSSKNGSSPFLPAIMDPWPPSAR